MNLIIEGKINCLDIHKCDITSFVMYIRKYSYIQKCRYLVIYRIGFPKIKTYGQIEWVKVLKQLFLQMFCKTFWVP